MVVRIMNKEKYIKYLAYKVKTERQKRDIPPKQFTDLANVSRSYISKIESGVYIGDLKLIKHIFHVMDINFLCEENELSSLKALLSQYFDEYYKGNPTKDIIEEITAHEQEYENSLLYDHYVLARLNYAVVNHKESRSLVPRFEELMKLILMDNKEMQIYYDCKGIIEKEQGNYEEAITYFKKGKSYGKMEGIYPILCYHMSLTYSRMNNLLYAYETAVEAKGIFTDYYNWNRQWHTEWHIASIYVRYGLLEKAEKVYKELYNKAQTLSLDTAAIIGNLSLNLMKQQKWEEVLNWMKELKDEDYQKHKIFYFYEAFTYYKLEENENSKRWIQTGLSSDKKDPDADTLLKMLDLVMGNTDELVRFEKLRQLYDENKKEMDNESKEIVLNYLIRYAKNSCRYKQGMQLCEELIKIQNSCSNWEFIRTE